MPKPEDQNLARLFSDSRAALSRYVRRLVRSPSAAEEIVQETYLRAYQHREDADLKPPYLFSIARNLASKARRHDRIVDAFSHQDTHGAQLHGTCVSPEDAALADERLRLLNEAIQALPPQCRFAFTLRIFQDCSYKQIAEQLGISVRTVEKHIARGAIEIHAALGKRHTEVN
ncbi:MAG: sigma-70 family RNA polymerase sigma factor [Gammaproteobacteria bacterium]